VAPASKMETTMRLARTVRLARALVQ
jgi:hypothetical protein